MRAALDTLETGFFETAVGPVMLTRSQQLERAGADPVVYLHSSGGETGADSVAPFLGLLAESFDVYAPMFPGFAGSSGLEQIDDMEDAVYHCLDVFERLGLTGGRVPHVVGLSLGGWMAAEIAWRHPESLRSLTIVSAPGIYVPGHPMGELFGRRFDELAEETFADQSHPVAAMMHQMATVTLAGAGAEIPFELIRPFFESMAAAAKLAWNPYFHNPKLPRRLGRVTAPTFVIAGRLDGLVPFQTSEAYARLIAGAELEIWDDCSHMIPLEQPARLAAKVAEHASRTAAAAG
ncbi:MAG TPA: alpha/beta hydrolase [Acidimicrobiales bacterium]|nr:alpha/beta hydrolase [Acidimicrobiales bacterium]